MLRASSTSIAGKRAARFSITGELLLPYGERDHECDVDRCYDANGHDDKLAHSSFVNPNEKRSPMAGLTYVHLRLKFTV